jgi:hypothetical protein
MDRSCSTGWPASDTDDTPENRAFRDKVGPTVKKYAGQSVRIEDSFLMTEKELVRLSAKVPRTTQEIDDFMRSRK